ncbi:MAG TPA: cyanophycin synthetase, partial [Alphaproteobacteria bacterium]|nr:cyanophycin synthetase [Alphaproteobacteria bacterium]
IAIAYEMGIEQAKIRASLASFGGVKRRLTVTGEAGGIRVIDDYGHHPVEIEAVMRAVRTACDRRVIAVVQPHRYTRLHNLFEEFCTCFNEADAVIVADVYAAGEAPIEGVSRDALVEGLRSHGHRKVLALPDPAALAETVAELAEPGDVVVCLGAGSITQWAAVLPDQLAAIFAERTGNAAKRLNGAQG